jgi:hypothetical protein
VNILDQDLESMRYAERSQRITRARENVAHRGVQTRRAPAFVQALALIIWGLLIVAAGVAAILAAIFVLGWSVAHPPLPFVLGAVLLLVAAFVLPRKGAGRG